MDFSFIAARILAYITPWALPSSILMLIISIGVDIFKKKFRWSKFALIFLGITIILLIIEIKLAYQISQSIMYK